MATALFSSATPRMSSIVFLAALGACGSADVAEVADPDAGFDNGTTHVTMTKQGDPKWETIGWQTFSAPQNLATAELVWTHHTWIDALGSFAPGAAHPPPYNSEIDDAIARNGWDPGDVFFVSSWTAPTGLMFAGALVPSPDAPSGKTADYASGPMIPDTVQIGFDADLLQGTTVVDPAFDGTYPTLAELAPAGGFDGWSHMPFTFGEDTRFIAGTPGDYALRIHIFEVATPANGWLIEIPFQIR
jgi:hypothetical protein